MYNEKEQENLLRDLPKVNLPIQTYLNLAELTKACLTNESEEDILDKIIKFFEEALGRKCNKEFITKTKTYTTFYIGNIKFSILNGCRNIIRTNIEDINLFDSLKNIENSIGLLAEVCDNSIDNLEFTDIINKINLAIKDYSRTNVEYYISYKEEVLTLQHRYLLTIELDTKSSDLEKYSLSVDFCNFDTDRHLIKTITDSETLDKLIETIKKELAESSVKLSLDEDCRFC